MISLQSLESGTENNFSSYETRKKAISNLKELIQKESSLIEKLIIKEPIKEILSKRCELNDSVIRYVAEQFFKKDESKLNIIAVGGYGRGEFYPKSDTDLLILLNKNSKNDLKNNISKFLTFLWDIGIEASHSTRTINECIKQSKKDISVGTSLLESRSIFGSNELFREYEKKVLLKQSWKNEKFFAAKIDEQSNRHNRFNNTAYNLEPNIKDGPGGLRDAHTIFWIAKKLGYKSIAGLEKDNILNNEQVKLLLESWGLLSKIRFALHSLAKRPEDRLLFDYQRILAENFGYKDSEHLMSVEVFMQDYYKAAKTISRFNEICLQIFDQKINARRFMAKKNINKNFHIRNKLIGLRKDIGFKDNPSLLLEIFLHFQENNIIGIESKTINQILENLDLINDEFRADPNNKKLFIKILKAPEGVTHELKRMNLYGVLGLYLPIFGQIEGRMQFDLFHTLTVDEHTLNVVSNLRRLALKRFDHEYPEDSKKMQSLESQEILYLAGLFHDIAKGRGGDHSILGAKDAEDFCISHGMTRYQSKLVSWLVENHLIFSLTAQKKDIHDPLVIKELASIIGDEERLEYLFLLTVCDVRATNPNLWNSWKERLFKDLYQLTKNALRMGLENTLDKEEIVKEKIEITTKYLEIQGLDVTEMDAAIGKLTEEYFLRFNQDEINYHLEKLISNKVKDHGNTIIGLKLIEEEGLMLLFIKTLIDFDTFSIITNNLVDKNVSIRDAKVIELNDGSCIYNFYTDMPKGDAYDIDNKLESLIGNLSLRLEKKQITSKKKFKLPRRLRSFSTSTKVNFLEDHIHNRTVLEMVSIDRPGLLVDISEVLRRNNIWIESAKIATIGERAEDVFYLRNEHQDAIPLETKKRLESELIESLDN